MDGEPLHSQSAISVEDDHTMIHHSSSAPAQSSPIEVAARPPRSQRSGGLVKNVLPTKDLLTLKFMANGESCFLDMSREDILRAARADMKHHVAATNDTRQPVGWTKSRDIRTFDSSFDAYPSAIAVRKGAVLVNLEPVRAVVLRDCALVFVPDGADSILSLLMSRLRNLSQSEEDMIPFEHRAYEAIFATVTKHLKDELDQLKPKVEATLKQVVNSSTGVTLELLRQAKNEVNDLLTHVEGVKQAFTATLDEDEDLHFMNLTEFFHNPSMTREVDVDEVDDVEVLLEAYLQLIDGTMSQLRLLTRNIESVESMIMIRLDSARNRLLQVELLLSSLTTVAGIGALFAGIFGMNLHSGLEETKSVFWIVASLLVFGAIVLTLTTFLWIRGKGLLIV